MACILSFISSPAQRWRQGAQWRHRLSSTSSGSMVALRRANPTGSQPDGASTPDSREGPRPPPTLSPTSSLSSRHSMGSSRSSQSKRADRELCPHPSVLPNAYASGYHLFYVGGRQSHHHECQVTGLDSISVTHRVKMLIELVRQASLL